MKQPKKFEINNQNSKIQEIENGFDLKISPEVN